MAFNSTKKLSGNIEALRLAFSEQGSYSDEEATVLKNYAGFGGLKAVLFGAGDKESWVAQNASANDLRLYPIMMELHQLLQEKLSPADYNYGILYARVGACRLICCHDRTANYSAAFIRAEFRCRHFYYRSGKGIPGLTGD